MKKEVLIVLGSPNSPLGVLSDISKNRLEYCKTIFKEGNLVLCTGGFGEQFNTSNRAHAIYAKEYLISKGLSEKDFLDVVLSSNTVDDAVKIKPIISKLENIKLIIITSDYHINRVKLIFDEILSDFKIKYIGVESNFKKEIFNSLVQHEDKAVAFILKNGLTF